MKVDLHGQVALVTGAATGIGKACALALRDNGATVVFSDRDAPRLRDTAGESDTVLIDVADRDAIETGVADVLDRHGRIDILVNNAGIGVRAADRKTFDAFPVEVWDQIIAIDLTGVFLAHLDERFAARGRRFGLPTIRRRPGRLQGFVLDRGRLWWYEDVEDAVAHHLEIMRATMGEDADAVSVDD